MFYFGRFDFAEKIRELLQVGQIIPFRVGRHVPFIPEIGHEIEDMLLHEDTLAYREGFCKDVSNAAWVDRAGKDDLWMLVERVFSVLSEEMKREVTAMLHGETELEKAVRASEVSATNVPSA